jgi:hypothetical protein
MFYTQKHRKTVESAIDALQSSIAEQYESFHKLQNRIKNLESMYNHLQSTVHEQAGFKFANHPRTYGLKQDGTPKAKPGRKPSK